MHVLMLSTYPSCNPPDVACKTVVDFFESFDAMVEFTDHWMGRTFKENHWCSDDHQEPGWDYHTMTDEEVARLRSVGREPVVVYGP